MSKSLGNGIDPLEVIDEYGADALRFTLATGNSPGNDMRFSDEKVKASRNFANKLWNAARFVLMYLTDDFIYNGLPQLRTNGLYLRLIPLLKMLPITLKNMSLELLFKSFMISFGTFSAIGISKLQKSDFRVMTKTQRILLKVFLSMYLPIFLSFFIRLCRLLPKKYIRLSLMTANQL